MDIKERILQYEKDFFSREFCCVIENLENRIDIGFIECGVSGIHSRQDVINALSIITEDRDITINGFECGLLSEAVVLARYKAHFNTTGRESYHSSVWLKVGNDWKIYYHQSTIHN
jgi:hypothetical protein